MGYCVCSWICFNESRYENLQVVEENDMTIYLDAIFFLNVLFDGSILLLIVLLNRRPTAIFRLVIGSLYAASSVFLILSPLATWFSHPMVKVIFSLGIIIVTFYPFSFRKGIQLFFSLYMLTFALGGFLLGMNYFFHQSMWIENGVLLTQNGGYGTPMSWWFVCAGFPIACFLYMKNDYHRKVVKLQAQSLYTCEFQFEWFHITCQGLLDTGNQLVDPLSNRPVVILDGRRFEKEIPNDLFQRIYQNESHVEETFDETWMLYRLKWIPYHALGKKSGYVIGMEVKQLHLIQGEKKEVFHQVLVGFAPERLCTEEFACILNPKIWL